METNGPGWILRPQLRKQRLARAQGSGLDREQDARRSGDLPNECTGLMLEIMLPDPQELYWNASRETDSSPTPGAQPGTRSISP